MTNRLLDVASRAGVSLATVSRVVNDRPGVAAPTRARVEAALSDLGYRPTGFAALRRTTTDIVGVIVPELDNPVFPAIAAALEERLSARGHHAVLVSTGSSGEPESVLAEALLDSGVEGLLFVSSAITDRREPHDLYRALLAKGVPMVFVNGRAADLPVPYVVTDERKAAELAVAHLVAMGHRRLAAIVGPLHAQPAVDKRHGFLAAAERNGIADPVVESADWGVEGGRAAMYVLLDGEQPPTGVICGSDLMAIGAMEAIRERGLDVPGDVSVVGFDNTELARHTWPPLTTIAQPIARMAETATNLLLEQVAGRPPDADPLHYVFRPELVARASSARPPE